MKEKFIKWIPVLALVSFVTAVFLIADGYYWNGTAYIGKLMVHPDYRCCGCGTKLLTEIEKFYPGKRYELFTSTWSEANIHLYQRNGYTIFDRKPVNDDLVFVYMEKTCDSNKLEMRSCEKVGAIIGNNPDARGRLENAGSV